MMPVVRIPDPVFERLKAVAEPLVDTPASVIQKLLVFYEDHRGDQEKANVHRAGAEEADPFHSDGDPLRFRRATRFGPCASDFRRVRRTAGIELERTGSGRTPAGASASKDLGRGEGSYTVTCRRRQEVRQGVPLLRRYRTLIQNVDANGAWRNAFNLAQRIGAPIRVTFEWRHKSKAAQPGKQGHLEWNPPMEHTS